MRKRWALRYYAPDGGTFTELRFRFRWDAAATLRWHYSFFGYARDGYRLELERIKKKPCLSRPNMIQ